MEGGRGKVKWEGGGSFVNLLTVNHWGITGNEIRMFKSHEINRTHVNHQQFVC